MAITKGAKKAHRQSLKKVVFNERRKRVVKDAIGEVRASINSKLKSEAAVKLKAAYQALDKAAKRGIIKKGTANRKKSRLAKAISKIQ